ncbi:MAG: twitching motility protein PilT [Catenulispora sp.]
MTLIYDAGALIAADRGDRLFALVHGKALSPGNPPPVIPAAVLGQVWRDGAKQARLARLLKSVSIEPLDETTSKEAGILCGRSATSDVIDASVVALAMRYRAGIVTSDPGDIAKLIDAYGGVFRPSVFEV